MSQLSKFAREQVRLETVELVHKFDKFQTKKRIQAIKDVRNHLTKCFMKVFTAFRVKKYGFELTPEKAYEYPEKIRRGMQNIDSQLTFVDNQSSYDIW